MAEIISPTPTSKYDVERNTYKSLDEMRAENIAKAAEKGDYTDLLSSDYDKIKADKNEDGKIDKNEYNTYVVTSNELKVTAETNAIRETNSKNYYYHIDNSLLLAIGFVCFTAVLISIINRIKKNVVRSS